MCLLQDARGLVVMKMALLVLLFMPGIFWLTETQWGSKIKTNLHIKAHYCFCSLPLFLDLEISFLSNLSWHWKWLQKGLANTGCFSPKGKCNYKILNRSQLSTPHRFKSPQEPTVFTKMQWPGCKLVIQNTNLKKNLLRQILSRASVSGQEVQDSGFTPDLSLRASLLIFCLESSKPYSHSVLIGYWENTSGKKLQKGCILKIKHR